MRSLAIALRAVAALAVGAGAVGCHQSPREVEVDFTERTPTTFAHHRATPLRVVIDLGVTPAGATRQDLATLAHKLASVLARSAEVAFARSSEAALGRLAGGAADLAFVGRPPSPGGAMANDRIVALARPEKGAATRLAIVAQPRVEPDERARWRSALTHLHEQPPNMATLARLSVARFVAPSPVAP